jgi:hypothetical protein
MAVSSTPAFDARLTTRTPNRWLSGLATLPLVAAAVVFFWCVAVRAPVAVPQPDVVLVGAVRLLVVLLAMGFVALSVVLRRRPLAEVREQRVLVDAETLHVGDDAVPRATIQRALLTPGGVGTVPRVRIERSWHIDIELLLHDEAQSHALLAALGHGVARSITRFRAASRALRGRVYNGVVALVIALN